MNKTEKPVKRLKNTYKKTPTIFQMEATECGAASLAMIFAYYGKHLPTEQMRIETGVSRDGCRAGNIMRAAKKYGLDCHGYRRELDELLETDAPCIIHWNFNHFVVYEGVRGKFAYINDPAYGRRKLTIEEFDDGFTGVVLTFAPTEKFTKEKSSRSLLHFIRERLKGQYSAVLRLLFVGFLLVFPGLFLPVTSQFMLDDVILKGNTTYFDGLIAFMAAIVLLETGLALYRSRVLSLLRNKLTMLSTHKFLSHMFRLPIAFFDQRSVGDLAGRAGHNENVSVFLAGELAEVVLNLFVACFYLVLLLIYSPALTLIGVFGLVLNLVIVKLSSSRMSSATMKMQQDSGKLAGAVCSGLTITSSLKASGTENEYAGRVLGYYAKILTQEHALTRFQQMINLIPSAAGLISDVAVILCGGIAVMRGDMTVGMLVAFHTLLDSFTAPVGSLVGFVGQIQTLRADMNRIDDIMQYECDKTFDETVTNSGISKLDGEVELDSVDFGYSILEQPLVENFSFHLNPGESVAFVGPSGCGKSTVSKIVGGLYSPWKGQVKFDGTPLGEIPRSVSAASIATVSQNITLFSGTVRDNITLWNESIPERDMIRAAKDACIHDIITQKPGAYSYRLTENAANLSGGQRQRLEIARALATNPSILIMDEATSALDPITEKQILDNIKRRGCTCIIVAHRLSAIRDCDRIIVMERGKIVQTGTHESLSSTDGLYREFIQNT